MEEPPFSDWVEKEGPADKAKGVARAQGREPRKDSVSPGERAVQEQEDPTLCPENGQHLHPPLSPSFQEVPSLIHPCNTSALGSR